MFSKMLLLLRRPKPSCSWLITHRRIDRISIPATHFFSTDAIESSIEDGRDNRKPTDKVELIGTIFRRYGFSNAQISRVCTVSPQILNIVQPEKTLLPKLEFFRGTIGLSNPDLPRFICSNPRLLTSSLHQQIVPCYNFIKSLLLSDDSDEIVLLKTLKHNNRLLTYNVETKIAPNIRMLRDAGVPQKQILNLMRRGASVFMSLRVRESIKRATEMGFHPNKSTFVDAIRVFTKMSKSTWDNKMEVYRKCGMTDEEILKAFRLFPLCMALAEGNIVQTMDFVVKKMGWQPVDVARFPAILGCSLEKRTVPRCRVVRYLQGKGLISKTVTFSSFLSTKEKDFIEKFVKKYEDNVPGLMDVYLGKTSPPPPQEPIL